MIELWTVDTANGQKASVVLEELGLDYRAHRVDLVAGEHRAPAMLALNPFGRLPFIRDGDIPVYGSTAIGLYLAEREGRLMPKALAQRAALYQWLGMLSSDLSPALAGQFLFSEIFPTRDAQVTEHFVETARRMFAVLDAHLASRRFIVGDALSLADLLAYPSCATSALRLPGQLADYPHLRRWADTIGGREAVQRGMKA